jgi:hypothetical protein
VPSYNSHAINAANLRSLELPEFTKAQIQQVLAVNEDVLKTQAQLAQKSSLLDRLLSGNVLDLPAATAVIAVDSNAQLLQNAQAFLLSAQAAGLTTSVGRVQVSSGKAYSVIKTASNVCIVENMETGGVLVARGDQLLVSDGLTPTDQEKFRQLAEISTEHLQTLPSRPEKQDLG